MSAALNYLAEQVKVHVDRINSTYKSVNCHIDFDGCQITIKVTFDKANRLGTWFTCTAYDKMIPFSQESIGIAIDYFDSKNYLSYLSTGTFCEDKSLKILAIIFDEFKDGDLFLRGCRFHLEYNHN